MRNLLIIIVNIFFLGWPAFAQTSNQTEIVTLVADNWCPYSCDPRSGKNGFMVDIAEKALGKHNIKVEYGLKPWTRAIEDTRNGLHSAVVGASRGDVPGFILPDLAQGLMINRFYVLASSTWQYQGIESLAGQSLGGIMGYNYGEPIDSYIQKYAADMSKIQLVSGEQGVSLNLKKLLKGRISVLLENENVIDYHIRSLKLDTDSIKAVGVLERGEQSDLYIAFSPQASKANHYAAIISKELAAMRLSGELKEILDAYSLTDWQAKTP